VIDLAQPVMELVEVVLRSVVLRGSVDQFPAPPKLLVVLSGKIFKNIAFFMANTSLDWEGFAEDLTYSFF